MAVRATIIDPVAAYASSVQLSLPRLRDVEAAAALLPRRSPTPLSRFGHQYTRLSPRTYEGPKWFLSVAPGVISVGRKLTAEKDHFGHTDGVTVLEDAPRRGRVAAWSEKSRNRMSVTLESLDYTPMFGSGGRAAMVTLTLPGEWEDLVPDLATFKVMVNRFAGGAYRKAWGAPLVGVWKMEFQRRGAPHLHILMVPPAGFSRGRGAAKGLPFHAWLSLRWAQIVGTPEGSRARRDHQLAGTGVDYAEVGRYSDPRRIGSYFAKHGSFAAKDYQNDMPDHWRDAILAGESSGARFWGYWGLDKAIVAVELQDRSPQMSGATQGSALKTDIMTERPWTPDRPPQDAVLVMRHLRKLAASRSFVRKVEVTRWQVNSETGEVVSRTRRVNRKVSYLKGRSRGYLAVNDGPATARDLARILHGVEGPGREPAARYGLVA